MNKHLKKPRNEEMYKAILTLNTVEELMKFFDDLCTVSELQAMEQRYQVAVLLSEGMIYNDILEKTGASSATISRVNRSLLNGTDAYDMVCNGVEVGAALLRFLLQKHLERVGTAFMPCCFSAQCSVRLFPAQLRCATTALHMLLALPLTPARLYFFLQLFRGGAVCLALRN